MKNKKRIPSIHPLGMNLNKQMELITFQQVSKYWLELCEIRNKISTFIKYKNLLDTYILPELGHLYLIDMNTSLIASFLKKQLLYGGVHKSGLSYSTIKSLQHVINSILQYAAEHRYMDKVEIRIDFLNPEFSQISILTEEDENRLVRYMLKDTDRYRLGILICLYTGIRIGELCALTWEDVNLSERYITINHTVQRLQMDDSPQKTTLYIGFPKSRTSIRIVPIPNFLVKIMETFRKPDEKDSFVLSGSEKVVDPRTMQYKFSEYLKKLDINRVNFHTLRHTFATRCVRIGFDIKTLSEILGHSNVNITLNRYVHSSIEMKKKQMQMVGTEWFGKIIREG